MKIYKKLIKKIIKISYYFNAFITSLKSKFTMLITKIHKDYQKLLGTHISVNGWVKTMRNQKQPIFISISDGSSDKFLQIIASSDKLTNMDLIAKITTGSSINVTGTLIESPGSGQLFEIMASEIKIYQICDSTFPLQKVGLSLEFMRTKAHQRHRSNVIRAVAVVKSNIMSSFKDYYRDNNYTHIDLPVLTTNACESGCQPLQVTSLINNGKISSIPVQTDAADCIDFTQDFFNNPVYMTVSNQLHLECFAHGLGRVWTITQATRGEPSQTTKHLACFNMLEAEFCFGDLSDNITVAESCIKYCVQQALLKCPGEMGILAYAAVPTDKNGKKPKLEPNAKYPLITKLEKIINEPFIRITHQDAITLLLKIHATKPFNNTPEYSGDLSGEHEMFLVQHFNHPVIVMYYPKAVKAFYMPVHHMVKIDDKTIEYVDCFDLLMDIGEVVGGSQRIWNEADLISRMEEVSIDHKHLNWYVDLRRHGSVPHGGFGLGIERLTAVITGMANVKDCISFPITLHHCTY